MIVRNTHPWKMELSIEARSTYIRIRGVKVMGKKVSIPLAVLFFLIPFCMFPKTMSYMKVGFVDIDLLFQSYIPKYLDAEIRTVDGSISRLRAMCDSNYFKISEKELEAMQEKLLEQSSKLSNLQSVKSFWEKTNLISDELIFEKIQNKIMETIKKTCVLEGYSLLLDRTGNFVYGSEDIDLTHRVLFRLEEKLLDMPHSETDESSLF